MAHVRNIQHDTLEDISIKSIKPSSKNFDEDGFVTVFKDLFGNSRNKFPNDFDAWTVNKQCGWIKQNIAEFFPNMPQSLQSTIPASYCYPDVDRLQEKLPEWIDIDKYRKGQKFVQKNSTAIIMSKVMGLMYIYSFQEQLSPIILGGNSHTPYLGFKKYLASVKRIFSWYDGDPWIKGTEAYKDMQVTRVKHLAVTRKVCQMDHEQISAACTFADPWCLDRELFLKDFAAASPPEKFGQRPYIIGKKSTYRPKGINNADLSIAQSCFVVLPLLYSQNVGIHDATDEDLEAFCHMWKCYGYFLGMEDEYNICRGSLEEIKQRVNDLYQHWVMQNFKELTPEWEHETRCLVEFLNYWPVIYMPYKTMTLIATDALNLNISHLRASLNYTEWIVYKIYKFIFYALKFSSVRAIINNVVRKAMDKAVNYNAEKLADIHEKSKKICPDFSIRYK